MSLAPSPEHEDGGRLRTPSGDVLLSKTCQNCFSLKIRCDRTQRGDICDRCARLGKQCVFRPAKRRDNSAKRDSRIQALEAQVQDLLRIKTPSYKVQQPLPEASLSAHPSPPSDGDVVDEDILPMERADTLVELYKSEMMPHFPFIIIPPTETGASLRHEKPFLFLAVLSVASFHDLAAQEKLGNRFKTMVTDKVLYGGDDCLKLEYLQGLMVVLAWNQYHGRSKYFTQYLQLAISIAVDMRLDRKPVVQVPRRYEDKRDPLVAGMPGTQTWGPEEQRASAGIFYISSTISKLLDKMNTYPCTQTIEDGCLALGQRAEYRTDKDLYHVIRLQKIIENIETLAKSPGSEAEAEDAYMRVRSQLEEFRAFLSVEVSDSHLLFMQFHTAKLFLFQVAFFERNLQQSPAMHLNILSEGLEGAKAFLDLYLWLPPKSEMALTNQEWVQLSFGVTQAAKFAIVSRTPAVEAQTRDLRHRLNIDHIFRHLALRIGALVGRSGGGDKHKDIFYHYEQRTRKIQNWYEKMTRATDAHSPGARHAGGRQYNGSPPHAQAPSYSTPSSYASSTQPSPMPATPLPHAHLQQPSQVPLSATFSHQQPLQNLNSQLAPVPLPDAGFEASTSVGMMPMGSYTTSQFGSVPSIAFPDLMSAPGWDTLFAVPMEDMSWLVDVSQGYGGMNAASSPSEGDWGLGGS
ncbi:hypothetical protein DPSP01_004141 [Paraphaeosphaeria sporulosa]|uniref:Zn(2)-C6 fungal-type domain-containing protein n=1 Tax=Paraphaeosphaeria sporulosa TaxID=1460663 RepID=A0A177CAG8_9PLEO|nr:uncharacterized protein CC84DRAFT_800078 [Paraphaeosphaeria sporulosa]OAG04653.1 hypothetical protein CC84DRAFT_800078 [Paraphaeosphaeria sporulosa]